ncbi:MAG: Ig-like domain-containing protein [Actinomycetota bacterium]
MSTRRAMGVVAIGALAMAGTVFSNSAGAAPVEIGLDCVAHLFESSSTPITVLIDGDGGPTEGGTPERDAQKVIFGVEAPAETPAGAEMTVKIPSRATKLPARSTGLRVFDYTNITATYRVTGATIVADSGVASGPPLADGVAVPAAPTIYTANTITVGTDGPVSTATGGVITPPDITFKVLAGAIGSTITVTLDGNTLTAYIGPNFQVPGRAVCVAPPNVFNSGASPILSSTLVVAPPPPPPPPGAPTAVNDVVSTTAGAGVTVNVLANDTAASDRAIDPASLKIKTAPTKGTATVGAGGITYTPNAGFSGGDTFQYEICSVGIPVTTTTAAPTTTTTLDNENTTTTAPATTTTAPGLDVGPCHFANVTVNVASVQAAAPPPAPPAAPAAQAAAPAPAATLPVTGTSSSAPLGFLGALFVLMGAGAVALVRRHRPNTR